MDHVATSVVVLPGDGSLQLVNFRWSGGPYIEVAFGVGNDPSEVINVWDDEKGMPVVPFTMWGLLVAVGDWVRANEENPDWYADYVANASH